MGDFKKLLVWRKAHALALNCHRVASQLRGSGLASLRSQLTRAALSIPTNIVEGQGQASKRDFARFLGYAINSASEVEYHLIVGRDIEAIPLRDFSSLHTQLVEVRKMIHGLKRSLGHAEPRAPNARAPSQPHRGTPEPPPVNPEADGSRGPQTEPLTTGTR